MEEKYIKMIDDRIQDLIDRGIKFIQLTNVVDGKERVFLIPIERYKKLTDKQKKFLMEDK